MAKPHVNINVCTKVLEHTNSYYGLALTSMVDDTIVVAVYFSPKCSLASIKTCIEKALDGFKNFPRIIIGGDFNEMNDLQFCSSLLLDFA